MFGQETKKVTEELNTQIKEEYYVLKSDKSIRHGNYQKLHNKNVLLINGFYKNGLKDSTWTEYRWDGKSKKSIGTFSEDKKIGIWEYYNFKGDLEQKYDHTKKELVYYKLDDLVKNSEYKVIKGIDTIKTKLDRPPLYIGGTVLMFELASKSFKYPKIALENGISGKVLIKFTIDINGKTSNHRIYKGIGFGCNEEALRIVKEIPENWIPGQMGGNLVDVEYIIPISFSLQ